MTRHFLNLTNGLEWLPELRAQGIAPSVVRITSTSIEKRSWAELFLNLDHALLLALARGEECILYDCGCRRALTKTIRVGVPLIRYCLERCWDAPLTPSSSPGAFEAIYQATLVRAETLDRQYAKRRLLYYRPLAIGAALQLRGCSRATQHDGDWTYYRRHLATWTS